jgi:DHA1 family bicyclomycin/chloramphenicol resistance-like MFS transporter
MQQTLSAYLFGFALMNLFHGALSDSFGRRPVVLWACGVHAGLGRLRAVAPHRHAGVLARGAGHVGRRGHRGVARGDPRHVPARRRAARDVAGDDLLRHRAGGRADGRRLPVRPRGWHAIFWFLTGVGVLLWLANWKLLPETLHATHQPFRWAT